MTNIIHDKILPWRLAQARKAAMKPLEIVSEAFQSFWNTWIAVFKPEGNKR